MLLEGKKVLVLDYRKEMAQACVALGVEATFVLSRRKMSSSEVIEHDSLDYLTVATTHNFEQVVTTIAEARAYPYDAVFAENEDGIIKTEALRALFAREKGNIASLPFLRSKYLQKTHQTHNLTTQVTRLAAGETVANFTGDKIVKPEFGAGSEATFRAGSPAQITETLSQNRSLVDMVIEDLVAGQELYADGWIDRAGMLRDLVVSAYCAPVLECISSTKNLTGMRITDQAIVDRVAEAIQNACKDFEITSRVFHAELFREYGDADNLLFSEIGFRYGGAYIPEAYELATGKSVYQLVVLLALGRDDLAASLTTIAPAKDGVIGWTFLACEQEKMPESLPTKADLIAADPHVLDAKVEIKLGETTHKAGKNSVNRAGTALISAPDEAAFQLAASKCQERFDAYTRYAKDHPVVTATP